MLEGLIARDYQLKGDTAIDTQTTLTPNEVKAKKKQVHAQSALQAEHTFAALLAVAVAFCNGDGEAAEAAKEFKKHIKALSVALFLRMPIVLTVSLGFQNLMRKHVTNLL